MWLEALKPGRRPRPAAQEELVRAIDEAMPNVPILYLIVGLVATRQGGGAHVVPLRSHRVRRGERLQLTCSNRRRPARPAGMFTSPPPGVPTHLPRSPPAWSRRAVRSPNCWVRSHHVCGSISPEVGEGGPPMVGGEGAAGGGEERRAARRGR